MQLNTKTPQEEKIFDQKCSLNLMSIIQISITAVVQYERIDKNGRLKTVNTKMKCIQLATVQKFNELNKLHISQKITDCTGSVSVSERFRQVIFCGINARTST